MILVPETTRFPESTGNLGKSIRNGLNNYASTIAATDSSTAAGSRRRAISAPAGYGAPRPGLASLC